MRAKLKEIKEELWRRCTSRSPNRGMAEAGRHRLLQLPRGADQHRGTQSLPAPCHQPVAAYAPAAQPEGRNDVGADRENGRRLAPETQDPSSVAKRALRRQTPEVGAVCPNWARSDLCGGMPAMAFPRRHGRRPCSLAFSAKSVSVRSVFFSSSQDGVQGVLIVGEAQDAGIGRSRAFRAAIS